MNLSMPGLPVHHQLPEFTQTHVHWVGDAIQPSHSLSSPSPPAPIPPSIRVFSTESTLHMRWPKYWSFSFSISPSDEHPGLISFKVNWLDLLAVQGTLKSLLQHHSSKASILQCSAFFTVQLSYPYLICLLRNLYAGQETTVRTGHETTDWFQIGKGVRQGCILSPCLFNLYAEYIMRNAGLEKAQAGIKIWENYQWPQICRWHHPYGRKWRRTKEPLDEGERGVKKLA